MWASILTWLHCRQSTAIKLLQKQKFPLVIHGRNYLVIPVKKLCQFFSEHDFIFHPYFQLYMKEKSLPSNLFLRNYHVHQRIPVKSTLLLRKNITCVNGILFRETMLLSLSLNFLGSINDYSIKNYKSDFINNFKKKLYQINKM